MAKQNQRILLANNTSDTSTDGVKLMERVENCAESLSKMLDLPIGYASVTGIDELDLGNPEELLAKRRREAEARLAQFSYKPELIIRFGSPEGEILKLIRARPRTEVVVMGTRGHTGFEHIWKGSVAEEVIRHSNRPVVVIGPRVEGAGQLPKKPSIIVATDFGEPAKAAEKYAVHLARRWGAELKLLFCLGDELRAVQEAVFNSGIVPYDFQTNEAELRAETERDLSKKAAQLSKQNKIIIKTEIRRGLTVNELPLAAKECDLLIMGTRGRHHLLSAFFGSTARATLLSSSVPVMIVPPNMKVGA